MINWNQFSYVESWANRDELTEIRPERDEFLVGVLLGEPHTFWP